MSPQDDSLLRWIPLLPLLGAVVHGVAIGVVRRGMPRWGVWGISSAAVGVAFVLCLIAFFRLLALPEGGRLVDTLYTWIGAGIGNSRLAVDLGFSLDPLAALMLLVVSGLSALVHVYSIAYMENDPRDERGYQRFFCYLGLATASMLVLVLADNLVLLFLGWQGVALCSWLLVAFWYSDEDHARFASQVFVVGRLADLGFLTGTFLLFTAFLEAELPASLLFSDIETFFYQIASQTLAPPWGAALPWRLVDVAALCFFVAACGKSAQLPLSVWLPNAVVAPPPAAALMLGTTTVGAGVYLLCRLSFLLVASTAIFPVMAWTGALTALFAAGIAAGQSDLRRALACLALCELGLVFLALGCAIFAAALFQWVIHAVVVSLLLLAAGSVVLALQGESSLERMGDLGRRLGKTRWVFGVGSAVLAGVPLGSIFFSKGAILVAAWSSALPGHEALFAIALLSVALTSFSIWRLYYRIFAGESRVPAEVLDRVLESPRRMLWPLYGLCILALCGGVFGIPQFVGDALFAMDDSHSLDNFLKGTLAAGPVHVDDGVEMWLMLSGLLAAGAGFGVAFGVYRARPQLALRVAESIPTLRGALQERLYLDVACDVLCARPLRWISRRVLFEGVELRILDGAVTGVTRALHASAFSGLRRLHTGLAHAYVFSMIAGTAAVVGYLLR